MEPKRFMRVATTWERRVDQSIFLEELYYCCSSERSLAIRAQENDATMYHLVPAAASQAVDVILIPTVHQPAGKLIDRQAASLTSFGSPFLFIFFVKI